MTRFVEQFDTVCDYTLQFTVTHTRTSTVMAFTAVAWHLLPTADIPSPLGSRTVPGSQPLQLSTNCLQTLSRALRRLTDSGNWSSLYSLGTDSTENTASDSDFIVVYYTALT